jgi:translation elongation factor EF-Tu-like GTPase
MPIENVLSVTGRGTVVTGAVAQGRIQAGRPPVPVWKGTLQHGNRW